ncbi:MAG: hypothetical protein LUC88_08295 [Prevotella sp.]|nr:hypothetical protein [Prevotella sp.]
MKIVERTKSSEPCVEAGWIAFDYHLDTPIDREFVLSLRCLGTFLFMENLAKPFFKIESHNYIIKGVVGDEFFRISVYRNKIEELDKIISFISRIMLG